MKTGTDPKPITLVHDMPSVVEPGLTPVPCNYYEDWNIRVVNRVDSGCDNYMSPNRRDFYKIMFMTSGTALKTMGTSNYSIEAPTILFLHPNEIVCWRNLSGKPAGIYCLFKKRYLDQYLTLKSVVEAYRTNGQYPHQKPFTGRKQSPAAANGLDIRGNRSMYWLCRATQFQPIFQEAGRHYAESVPAQSGIAG